MEGDGADQAGAPVAECNHARPVKRKTEAEGAHR